MRKAEDEKRTQRGRTDPQPHEYDTQSLLRRRPDAAGIQLPGYSGAQGTEAELRGVVVGQAVVSAVFYYITADGTKCNLTTFLGEKAL